MLIGGAVAKMVGRQKKGLHQVHKMHNGSRPKNQVSRCQVSSLKLRAEYKVSSRKHKKRTIPSLCRRPGKMLQRKAGGSAAAEWRELHFKKLGARFTFFVSSNLA